MAFIKLFPPEGRAPLPIADLVRLLGDEFAVVDANPDGGQDHVASMIDATLRFSDAVPGKQERLAYLQGVQNAAVMVTFGDTYGVAASCCLIPNSELFFGSPNEVYGSARPLVRRAATALGHEL